jgi:succinyl-diaminopimelate desuccinylase
MDVARRTLELVNIPSVSRDEAAIAEHVASVMPWEPAWRDGETLWYETPSRGRPLVVLAGHLDTVPAQGNVPGRIEDGVVHGLGASDMKGGVAVMIELARSLDSLDTAFDLGFVFFPREELPQVESPLPDFFRAVPRVREAELAVVLEPTDVVIHAGCMGNLNAELVFRGVSAHSARPWLGDNAIERAVNGLHMLVGLHPQDVEVGGLVFREVVTLTGIEGGLARNVVPDRVVVRLNHRFAPGRSTAEAEEWVRALVPASAEFTLLDVAGAADVATDNELVQRLISVGGLAVEPKQAWTPVAEFSSAGIPAVNFGPGATPYAHKRDEQIPVANLERAYDVLRRFVTA